MCSRGLNMSKKKLIRNTDNVPKLHSQFLFFLKEKGGGRGVGGLQTPLVTPKKKEKEKNHQRK